MTWFKVDDSLPDHPKVIRLQSLEGWQGALALWTLAGAWSSRHLTDGILPAAVIARIGCSERDAELLVEVGMWRLNKSGNYSFHEWSERNPTRKEIETKRAKTRERVADWRNSSSSERNVVTDDSCNTVTEEQCNTSPVPSRPVLEEIHVDLPSTAVQPAPERKPRTTDPVFLHWTTAMGLSPAKTKLNAKRREKLRARRAEGYTDEQLCQAIDGCRLSPFHMGQNDRSEVYNDLATILRDGTTVEKHIGRLGGPGTARPASSQLRPDRPRNTGMMGGLP